MKMIQLGVPLHRLWSLRFSIAATIYSAAAGGWEVMPHDWRPDLTHTEQMILAGIGVLIPAAAAVSRVIAQPSLHEPPASPDDPKC